MEGSWRGGRGGIKRSWLEKNKFEYRRKMDGGERGKMEGKDDGWSGKRMDGREKGWMEGKDDGWKGNMMDGRER